MKALPFNLFISLILTSITVYILSDSLNSLNSGAIGLIALFYLSLTTIISCIIKRKKNAKSNSN